MLLLRNLHELTEEQNFISNVQNISHKNFRPNISLLQIMVMFVVVVITNNAVLLNLISCIGEGGIEGIPYTSTTPDL
jgi:hypothetical protein